MEYKRLTRRNADGTTWVKCAVCDIEDRCDFTKETCCQELQDRLAELEDKIENGTLIDTKVKIGQRVFRFGFFKGDFDEYIVSNVVLENGELEIHLKHDFDEHSTCYSVTVLGVDEIGKTVFLTREEAEKRLEELKG